MKWQRRCFFKWNDKEDADLRRVNLGSAAKSVSAKSLTLENVKLSISQFWLCGKIFAASDVTVGFWLRVTWQDFHGWVGLTSAMAASTSSWVARGILVVWYTTACHTEIQKWMKTQKKENTKVANMECSTNMARDDTCGRPPQLSNIQFTHIRRSNQPRNK